MRFTTVPATLENPGEFGEPLFREADEALNQAKAKGRNCVHGQNPDC